LTGKNKQESKLVLNPEMSQSNLPCKSFKGQPEKLFKLKLPSDSSDLKSPGMLGSSDRVEDCWKEFLETIQKQNVKTLYKVEAVIGLGTYGKVRLARDRVSKKLVAVKSLRITDSYATRN
jgi:hypothetical protein